MFGKRSLAKKLEEEMLRISGVSSCSHDRGGREFQYQGKEIGHIHWNGDLDILFNLKIKAKLTELGLVQEHYWIPKSGWTTFKVNSYEDVPQAKDLLIYSLSHKTKALESKMIFELQDLIYNSYLKSSLIP